MQYMEEHKGAESGIGVCISQYKSDAVRFIYCNLR